MRDVNAGGGKNANARSALSTLPTPQTKGLTMFRLQAVTAPVHQQVRQIGLATRLARLVLGQDPGQDPGQHAGQSRPAEPDLAPLLAPSAQPLGPASAQVLLPRAAMSAVTPIKAIGDAIQGVTADFLRRNLADLFAVDPSTYFRVEAVCFHESDALKPHLRDFFRRPPAAVARHVAILMRQVPGAADMLDLSSLGRVFKVSAATASPQDEPCDGYPGTTLLVFDGPELPLTIEFIGDYAERAPAAAPAAAPPGQAADPAQAPAPLAVVHSRKPGSAASAEGDDDDKDMSTTRVAPPRLTPKAHGDDDDGPASTRVAPRRAAQPQPKPLLILKLREVGQAERSLPIHERDLPLHIGREVGDTCLHLSPDSFVSRNHLVLQRYRHSSRLLQIDNKGRNGTFNAQGELPEQIGYVVGQDQWLSLGGALGDDGTLKIRFEEPSAA